MPEFIANHKGFFLCTFSMVLAFAASFFSKVDLNQIITTITMTYMGAQTTQRGAAYFAAANDPNSSTQAAIETTLNKKDESKQISQYAWLFQDIPDSCVGCEKAYDGEEEQLCHL